MLYISRIRVNYAITIEPLHMCIRAGILFMIQCVHFTVPVNVMSRTICCRLDKERGMKAGRRHNNREEQRTIKIWNGLFTPSCALMQRLFREANRLSDGQEIPPAPYGSRRSITMSTKATSSRLVPFESEKFSSFPVRFMNVIAG